MEYDQDKPLEILLADDDRDDRFFFDLALKGLSFPTRLTTVVDGEKLMTHLYMNANKLPDVLFLDFNMPRKNGAECLTEIKMHPKLRALPVIIYTTSLQEDMADSLFKTGAHYYFTKRNYPELTDILEQVLTTMIAQKFVRSEQDNFFQTHI